jgi:hypothetical protein
MSRMPPFVLAFVLLAWSSRADTVDTCAYLDNFDLTAALNSIYSTPDVYGTISQCLCVSGINGTPVIVFMYHGSVCILDFISRNPPASLAVSKSSMSRVVGAIAEIV